MEESKILVIGSSNTDMIIKVSRIPGPGETILGGEFFKMAGGKGANQAVAAGDTFNGYLAVALAKGEDIIESIRWANRVASISVTRMGAQASVPYQHEISI